MAFGVPTIAHHQVVEGLDLLHRGPAADELFPHRRYVFGVEHELVRIPRTTGRRVDRTLGSVRLVEPQAAAARVELEPYAGGILALDRLEIEEVSKKPGALLDIADENDDSASSGPA